MDIKLKCTCGDGEYCKRRVTISEHGVLGQDPETLYLCGEVKKQAKGFKEMFRRINDR